jgi:hypothetical protein
VRRNAWLDSKRFQKSFPGVSNGTLYFAFASTFFYFLALFPSRNHWDTVAIMELSRRNESSNQWTAVYFRLLELFSLKGTQPYIPAFLGIAMLAYAVLFFVFSIPLKPRILNLVSKTFLISPYVGVFGMTLTHELQSTTGMLLMLGVVFRKANKIQISQKHETIIILLGFTLFSTVYIGFFVGFFFCVVLKLLNYHRVLFLTFLQLVITLITFLGSPILGVTDLGRSMRYQSLVGDIKCITQHPNSKISNEQWRLLQKFGSKIEWTTPSTCAYADKYFAGPSINKNPREFVGIWLSLVKNNPQLALEARIQRSAIGLPPLFFTKPQNSIEIDYLSPAGNNSRDDLLIWSPLFKTSNDDPYQLREFPRPEFLFPLEALAILPAQIMMRNSSLWGWGGLWMSLAFILMLVTCKNEVRKQLILFIPLISVSMALFLVCPISDPRYAMPITIPSILITLAYGSQLILKMRKVITGQGLS